MAHEVDAKIHHGTRRSCFGSTDERFGRFGPSGLLSSSSNNVTGHGRWLGGGGGGGGGAGNNGSSGGGGGGGGQEQQQQRRVALAAAAAVAGGGGGAMGAVQEGEMRGASPKRQSSVSGLCAGLLPRVAGTLNHLQSSDNLAV